MRAIIFDLDGTLVDTVYVHVIAWQQAFEAWGARVPAWRIHRRIGMGVETFIRTVCGELGRTPHPSDHEFLKGVWRERYGRIVSTPTPLPGAVEILRKLREEGIPHGITTGAGRPEIDPALEALGVGGETVLVEGSEARRGKPEPDLFLACAAKLGRQPRECWVVADGVHDMLAARLAGMVGVGVLSGGQRESELYNAGAYRVFPDLGEVTRSAEEIGMLSPG